MIDTPTLFILGAGASSPYKYPTGRELRTDIVKNCLKDFDSLEGLGPQSPFEAINIRDGIPQFVDNFKGSSLKSIDKYLALNTSDQHVGKFAITQSILKSERASCFREDVVRYDEDWYFYLFNRMTESLNKPEDYGLFWKNKVAFITFNYDRSLEYFLYDSFYHSFHQSCQRQHIKSCVPFPIIHVYGAVSSLSLPDWYNYVQDYGKIHNYFKSVKERCEGIHIIGEERSGEDIKAHVKKLFADYKRIFFLGFSFAQENLDAINLPSSIDSTWKIFGTAKGLSEKERTEARERISVNFGKQDRHVKYIYPLLEDVDSCALLRKYL